MRDKYHISILRNKKNKQCDYTKYRIGSMGCLGDLGGGCKYFLSYYDTDHLKTVSGHLLCEKYMIKRVVEDINKKV